MTGALPEFEACIGRKATRVTSPAPGKPYYRWIWEREASSCDDACISALEQELVDFLAAFHDDAQDYLERYATNIEVTLFLLIGPDVYAVQQFSSECLRTLADLNATLWVKAL